VPPFSQLTCTDIGLAVGNRSLTDSEKLALLELQWTPSEDFKWPYSEYNSKGKLRRKYLGPQHLSGEYACFSYSLAKQGVFLRYQLSALLPAFLSEAKFSDIEPVIHFYNHLLPDEGDIVAIDTQ
jgi:hypothetical protein